MKFTRIIGVTNATGANDSKARVIGRLEIEAENDEQADALFRIVCHNPIVWGMSEAEYHERLKTWADEEAEKAAKESTRVAVARPDLKLAQF